MADLKVMALFQMVRKAYFDHEKQIDSKVQQCADVRWVGAPSPAQLKAAKQDRKAHPLYYLNYPYSSYEEKKTACQKMFKGQRWEHSTFFSDENSIGLMASSKYTVFLNTKGKTSRVSVVMGPDTVEIDVGVEKVRVLYTQSPFVPSEYETLDMITGDLKDKAALLAARGAIEAATGFHFPVKIFGDNAADGSPKTY